MTMETNNANSFEVITLPAVPTPIVETATGPGYVNVRYNALKHGVLSRHTVLAHEDGAEFGDLLAAMAAEHRPAGPTETHLVEELAGAIWRKRRVLQAEGASINRGLLAVSKARHDRPTDPDGPARAAVPFEPKMAETRLNFPVELAEAIREAPAQTRQRAVDAETGLAATLRAAEILRRGGGRAYDKALRALTAGSAESWAECLEDEDGEATAESLTKHIDDFLLPLCRGMVLEVDSHEAIKAQTLGEGLQAHRLEKLNRYETHLDRKFERTLAMLLKLKALRLGA
jgi:hypothetical protein